MKYYLEEIEWETDGEAVDLPKEEVVDLPDDIAEEDIDDAVNEILSERHGFLTLAFGYSLGRTFNLTPMTDLVDLV